MKKINFIILSLIFTLVFTGCSTNDLEPTLEQEKDIATSITKVDNLYAILKGGLSRMTASGYYGRDFIIVNEIRTDNCFSNGNSGRFTTEAGFNYSANTGYVWDDCYRVISTANLIINTDITALEGDQDYGEHLQGQAYFLRALAHFDLVKSYGQQHVGGTLGVPYIKKYLSSTSEPADLYRSRNTVEEVKGFIFDDLQMAFDMMGDDDATLPTKLAAKALESRVAVYFGMWPEAKLAAEEVIGEYSIIGEGNFVSSFDGNSPDVNSIFELAYNATDNEGINGLAYIYRRGPTSSGSYGDIQVLTGVELIFEANDVRGLAGGEGILGYEQTTRLRNIGKYPDNQGYDNVPLIRYEEVVLNYAEALFEIEGALSVNGLMYLNSIPTNRGASPYLTLSKDNILLERRKELMFEGFRYDDLLRTGKDIVKTSLQQNIAATIPYGDPRMTWAIPQAEMDANSNMVQNEDY